MSVTTKPYEVSRFEYFGIFMSYYLRRGWWMILLLLGFGIWNFYQTQDTFVSIIIVIFLNLFVFAIWRRLGAAANKTVFSAKQFHFEEGVITATLENGQETKLPISRLLNIIKTPNHYMLFVNKSAFYYLPKFVFKSAEDFAQFEKMINNQHS